MALDLSRLIQLAVAMLVFGGIWFYLILRRLKKDGSKEAAAKKQARQEAIKYSVIFGAFYMVLVLANIL